MDGILKSDTPRWASGVLAGPQPYDPVLKGLGTVPYSAYRGMGEQTDDTQARMGIGVPLSPILKWMMLYGNPQLSGPLMPPAKLRLQDFINGAPVENPGVRMPTDPSGVRG